MTARVCRNAPDEALQYKSYSIPPGTPISMTTLCVHTHETIYPKPWGSIHDQWLGQEGTERRKYLMAFNKGEGTVLGSI